MSEADIDRVGALWTQARNVRSEEFKMAQERIKTRGALLRSELADLVEKLMKKGVTKTRICNVAGIARPTLDRILLEQGKDKNVKAAKYRLERGKGQNIHLRGTVGDTGGFPELERWVDVRFFPLRDEWQVVGLLHEGSNLNVPMSDGLKAFLWEQYGSEVLEWSEESDTD